MQVISDAESSIVQQPYHIQKSAFLVTFSASSSFILSISLHILLNKQMIYFAPEKGMVYHLCMSHANAT